MKKPYGEKKKMNNLKEEKKKVLWMTPQHSSKRTIYNICNSLTHTRSLTHTLSLLISLYYNKIGDDGACAIGASLGSNTCLRDLK